MNTDSTRNYKMWGIAIHNHHQGSSSRHKMRNERIYTITFTINLLIKCWWMILFTNNFLTGFGWFGKRMPNAGGNSNLKAKTMAFEWLGITEEAANKLRGVLMRGEGWAVGVVFSVWDGFRWAIAYQIG